MNDGSSDSTLERLQEAFDLVPYEVFVRHVFRAQPVRGIYRRRLHPNLVVVDKENGGKADGWNAALNVAAIATCAASTPTPSSTRRRSSR